MASRRQKKRIVPAYERGREFKLRLPPDVSERIEKKAEQEGRPQNRVIINELADYPDLLKYRDFAYYVTEMRNVLAAYGSRITLADLGESLVQAVDSVLSAQTDGELHSRLDRLRVLRAAMLKGNT
jgi:Arc-like DNA binding dprotein